VAARALQGVGAAATMAGTLAMLSESAVDDWERGRLVGLWAALGGIALPLGPLLGGLLVDLGSWRAVFWLNLPIIVAALVPIIVHHPASPRLVPGSGDAARETGRSGSSHPSRIRLALACLVAGRLRVRGRGPPLPRPRHRR